MLSLPALAPAIMMRARIAAARGSRCAIRLERAEAPGSLRRRPARPAPGVICEPLVVLGDPQHHSPRFRIRQLVGDAARLLGAFEPMLGVIENGMGCGHLHGLRAANAAERYRLGRRCTHMWTADMPTPADMPTSKECRQHAEECLRLANETTQIYARQALLELAAKFREIAKQLETRSSSAHGAKQQRRARSAAAPPTRRRRAC